LGEEFLNRFRLKSGNVAPIGGKITHMDILVRCMQSYGGGTAALVPPYPGQSKICRVEQAQRFLQIVWGWRLYPTYQECPLPF